MYPIERELLPLREALGRIDAEHVGSGLHELGYALDVVARVDASAHDVALVLVHELIGAGLVRVIVLAKDKRGKVAVIIHHGERVELVIPDYVVAGSKRAADVGGDTLAGRRHELRHALVPVVARDAIIAARHDATEPSVRPAVRRDGHRGVTRALAQCEHVSQCHVRRERRVRDHKARLVGLDLTHHGCLVLRRLRAIDEGDATLLCERYGQAWARDSLHDGRDQRDMHRDGGLLSAIEPYERSLQRDIGRDVFARGVARNQQILREGVGLSREENSHGVSLSIVICARMQADCTRL